METFAKLLGSLLSWVYQVLIVSSSLPTRFRTHGSWHRPYISYGDLAHFEGGSELDLGDKFSITASGYYILPWGPRQIFLRGKKTSSSPAKGGPSLTRDDGINLGFDYNLTRSLDLSAGYSAQYVFLRR